LCRLDPCVFFSAGIIDVCCVCVGLILVFFWLRESVFLFECILVLSKSELLVCAGWILVFLSAGIIVLLLFVCRLDPGVFSFQRESVSLFERILVLSKSEWLVCVGWILAFLFPLESLFFVDCVSVGSWRAFFCGNQCFCLNGFW